jgi:hypothetical protein
MPTTELISILTGFIYLVAMGTFWKAKIRFSIPMLFALAFYFNFLIGGISGVFLSDVPADTTEHGSFFVMAHFHDTIMGGLIFAFMTAIYYWLPKMTGIKLLRAAADQGRAQAGLAAGRPDRARLRPGLHRVPGLHAGEPVLVTQLAALIWLEMLLARSRYIPALSFVEQPPTYTETHLVQRFQASLSAFSTVWNFLALMAVLFWLLFYAL